MVNRRVAWADKRSNQKYAAFDARVIASIDEQDEAALRNRAPLRQLPRMGEVQLPVGEGLEPPSQPALSGLEPDLPATNEEQGDLPLE